MEVFSLIDLQNSSISGEGNGTKLQKLDPERISALIGLFFFLCFSFLFPSLLLLAHCLFIPYPPSKYSVETRVKNYISQRCSDARKSAKKQS
jgi:hypothetical protein